MKKKRNKSRPIAAGDVIRIPLPVPHVRFWRPLLSYSYRTLNGVGIVRGLNEAMNFRFQNLNLQSLEAEVIYICGPYLRVLTTETEPAIECILDQRIVKITKPRNP
jgi:hypothetical protein